MSWKEDINTIVEKMGTLEKMLQVVQGQLAFSSKRIEAMRVAIEQSDKTRSRAADRMADRMIEMAMVNQGKAIEAASHRRSLVEEETGKDGDPWQDSSDTQWPPPECDEVRMP